MNAKQLYAIMPGSANGNLFSGAKQEDEVGNFNFLYIFMLVTFLGNKTMKL